MPQRRKALPSTLPDAHRRLVEELRRTVDGSGLSYAQLAERTHYSQSSWGRLLNGEQLPTRSVMRQLARTFPDGASDRLLPLWELASAEQPDDRAGHESQERPGATPDGSEGRVTGSRLKALLRLTAAAAVGAAVTATVFMSTGDAQGSDPSTVPTRATSTAGHAIFYPAGADLYNCDDYTDGYGSAVQWKVGETGDVRSRFNRAGAGTCQQSRVARAGENGVPMRSCLSKVQRIIRCGPWRSIGAG